MFGVKHEVSLICKEDRQKAYCNTIEKTAHRPASCSEHLNSALVELPELADNHREDQHHQQCNDGDSDYLVGSHPVHSQRRTRLVWRV